MAIDDRTEEYDEHVELWSTVRAAIKGKYAVLSLVGEDGCLCSPMYKPTGTAANLDPRQKKYWSRGRYFNATGRTFDALNGMIWSNDPVVELPTKLNYMIESADGFGTTLRDVVQVISSEVATIGRYGALVDMPSVDTVPTIGEQESGAMSPRIIGYKAEDIIYYRYQSGTKKLAEVRLAELYEEATDDADSRGLVNYEVKTQIRRLVLIDGVYYNEVWRGKQRETQTQPKANGSPLNVIPFYFFGADANTAEYGSIPAYDLASMNLGHFVLDCDNRDNLHYHGQGMTNIFTGADAHESESLNPNGLDVGAKGKNQFLPGDRVEVLQIEATGAIPAEMLRDQERMVMLGAQLVQDVNSNVTLGAKEMEFGASTATLRRVSRNVSIGVEWLLGMAGIYLADAGDIQYRLNEDFVTDAMDAPMVAQHLAAIQAGALPGASFFDTARKVGFTNKEDQELEEELDTESAGIEPIGEGDAIAQAAADAGELDAE